MKKIYTLALGLLLGGLGLSANAATVTDVAFKVNPETNEWYSYEEMSEYVGNYWTYVYWGEILETAEKISYNTESPAYNIGRQNLDLDVYINDEFYAKIAGDIWYEELDLYIGDIWEDIPYDFDDDFYMEIVIPEGCVFVGENGNVNQKVTAGYFISMDGGGSYEPDNMSYPTIELDDYDLFVYWDQEIFPMDGGSTVKGFLYVPGDGMPENVTLALTSWRNGVEGETPEYSNNALLLNLAPYVEEYGDGRYQLYINAGVVNDGEDAINTAVSWSDILVVPRTPVDYVYFSINTKEITLLYDYDVTINPYCEANIAVYDPMGDGFASPTSNDITIVGGQVTINLAPYNLEDGVTYYYEIPAGYFIIGEDYINDFIEGEFNKTSGINGIGSEFENAAIYNLQGVRVDRSNLVKGGIYIINGKKVAVK